MTAPRVRVTDPLAAPTGLRDRLAAYVELTKPRIVELLLITTVPAMVVAAGRWPGWWPVVATLIGGTLSAGGANAINNVVDRDIDRLMRRTRRRPLPTDRIDPARALAFGIILGAGGFAWLWATVGLLAGALSTAGLLFYVFVYTLTLKRATTLNIVIGGAAGAVPALVGWAAVTGTLAVPAWVMFGIVFFWTPPHFWALALRYREDYQAAGVPMLPAVASERTTLSHILWYTITLVGVSLLLIPAAGLGAIYTVSAAALGGAMLVEAVRLRARPERAMVFFGLSNVYLAALFVAMAVDAAVLDAITPGWRVVELAATALAIGGGLSVTVREIAAGEERGVQRPLLDAAAVLVTFAGLVALVVASWSTF